MRNEYEYEKEIYGYFLAAAMCGSALSLTFASPAPDGKTDASAFAKTTNTDAAWTSFQKK